MSKKKSRPRKKEPEPYSAEWLKLPWWQRAYYYRRQAGVPKRPKK